MSRNACRHCGGGAVDLVMHEENCVANPDNKPVPYRPSNGTEGDWFHGKFCHRCEYQAQAVEDPCGNGCEVLAASLAFSIDEDGYPGEWISDPDGKNPRCTKFCEIGTGTHEQRAKDQARYDAAMAEMKAAQQ